MNLFQLGDFTLHSGDQSQYKLECDALTDADWEALAYMGMEKMGLPRFSKVIGVPRGGLKLAAALQLYLFDTGPTLIVDDVLTSGNSMAVHHLSDDDIGLVVFARGACPLWVTPIFQM